MRRQAGLGEADRQLVVAIEARQLFDQVHLDADVETVAGHTHLPATGFQAGHGQTQAAEQTLDLGIVQGQTQDALDALGAQQDRLDLRQVLGTDRLDHRARLTADDVQQQAGCTLHGLARQLEVHAPLEAVGGIGVQAIGTGLTGDGDGVEEGAFQEQVTGTGGHTAVLATHDAGDGQGTFVVGDHQGVVAQFDVLAIQQHQAFAGIGQAHADAALDLVQIEGMHGLTQFEHHVVGDVDGGVDAAHATAAQTLDHPVRGRAGQVDVLHYATQVARAGLGSQHLDRTGFLVRSRYGLDLQRLDRGVVQGTHFPRQTGDGQTVAAVRGQVDVDDGVVQLQVAADALAHRRAGRQLQQAAVVVADLQFAGRAEHAVGFHAAQLGLLDGEVAGQRGADGGERHLKARAHIGRAADHLEGFLAVADLADIELVGIGMTLDGNHFADDDALEATGRRFDAVHFQAGHGQPGNQILVRSRRVHPATQPLFTEFHRTPVWQLAELRQEAQIVVEEEAQVVDPVAQHGQALGAHAKGEALVLLWIDAGHAQDVGVDHSAAQHLEPARGRFAIATRAANIHLGRRLGEGEVGGTEADFQLFLEEFAQEGH